MSAGAEKWVWVVGVEPEHACFAHSVVLRLYFTYHHQHATYLTAFLCNCVEYSIPLLLLLILYTRHLGGKEQLCRRRRRRGEASAFHFVVWKIEWKLNIRKLSIEIFRYGNEEYNI